MILSEGIKNICKALKEEVPKKLTTFNISYNEIGSEGAQCLYDTIPCLTSLKKLNLSGNKFDKIESSSGQDNKKGLNIGKEIAKASSGLEFLEYIGIAGSSIDSQGALYILNVAKNLENLKVINISGNYLIDENTKARIKKELKKAKPHPTVLVF